MQFTDLTPHEFDQTDQGWRQLDGSCDYIGAARAIEEYIQANRSHITTNPSLATMYFHAGQEYAMAGEVWYERAVACFEKSTKGDNAWDLYVQGTIAYLRRDSGSLDRVLAGEPDNRGILERFLQCLNQGVYAYDKAY